MSMQPGHIRVFDGLRITTEHVEHLQGALHSALQDLREIIGVGKVYRGFEVVAANDQAITVQPGLAFDFEKNRIVCDEPETRAVTFGPDDETQYVCIKYDQVEDGQVDGQFTVIWDNCAVVLRPTVPEPGENLIPIAQLNKSTADGMPFEIVSLLATAPEPTPDITDIKGKTHSEKGVLSEAEVDEAMLAIAALAEIEGLEEISAAETMSSASSSPEDEKAGTTTPSTSATSKRESKPWRLKVQQGILRLPAELGPKHDLGTLLLEPLKRTNSSDGVLLTLAEKEVPLEFPVSSLTCQTVISVTVNAATGTPASAAEPPQEGSIKLQATANGEATFMPAKISQFGLSKVQAGPIAGVGAMPLWTSETTEAGIAHLTFMSLRKTADDENAGIAWKDLRPLNLLVKAERVSTAGFKISSQLVWKGEETSKIISKIQSQKIEFTWETLVAWKALGELPV